MSRTLFMMQAGRAGLKDACEHYFSDKGPVATPIAAKFGIFGEAVSYNERRTLNRCGAKTGADLIR